VGLFYTAPEPTRGDSIGHFGGGQVAVYSTVEL